MKEKGLFRKEIAIEVVFRILKFIGGRETRNQKGDNRIRSPRKETVRIELAVASR